MTMVASGDRLFPRLFTPEISAFYEDAFAKVCDCRESLKPSRGLRTCMGFVGLI